VGKHPTAPILHDEAGPPSRRQSGLAETAAYLRLATSISRSRRTAGHTGSAIERCGSYGTSNRLLTMSLQRVHQSINARSPFTGLIGDDSTFRASRRNRLCVIACGKSQIIQLNQMHTLVRSANSVQRRATARRKQCFATVCAGGNVNYATVVAKISLRRARAAAVTANKDREK
jgi:hypothetical protein